MDISRFPNLEAASFDQVNPIDVAIDALDRDGAIIIEDLAAGELMDGIEREIEPYLCRTPNGEGLFFGRSTKRMGRLFLKSPGSRELATQPTVLEIAETVLGRLCRQIQINLTQAIRIEPGEREQILHNDDEFFPVGKKTNEQFMINALWAYSDFTRENGATRLVPGSHRKPIERNPRDDEICYAEMKRGSVLIYFGSVLHGGGANRTLDPRTAVVVSYSLGWLRQAENQYLAYPPEVAKDFPSELQRLVGYAIHEPNLGWFEGQDPRVLFNEERPEFLAARDNMPPEIAALIEKRYQQMTQRPE